jgi:acetyl esterase
MPGPVSALELCVYEPFRASAAHGALIFFAGGGYVVGRLYGQVALCRQLAASAGCAVISVETRLAPEHRFPAPVVDAYAAACWIHENADDLGIDHERIAIGGEGAGATLATVVCRLAKERRNPPLALQLLLYPWVDLRAAALAALPETARLERATLAAAADWYAPGDAERNDARCSALAAKNLIGVPPALIVSGELDPLREQIAAYAAALRAAHVPVTSLEYTEVGHGFLHAPDDATVRRALEECSSALRAAIG